MKNRNNSTLKNGIDMESPIIVNVNSLSGKYQLPNELLEEEKEYAWKACVSRREKSVEYVAHSDLGYFETGTR